MDTLNLNNGQPIFRDIYNTVIFATSNITNGINPYGILLSANKITLNYTFNNYSGYKIAAIIINNVAVPEHLLLSVFSSGYNFNQVGGFNTIYAEYYFEGVITITANFDHITLGGTESNMTPFIKITNLNTSSIWMLIIANNLNKTLIINEEGNFEITFVNPINHNLNYDATSPIQTNIFTLNANNPSVQIDLIHQKTKKGYIYSGSLS